MDTGIYIDITGVREMEVGVLTDKHFHTFGHSDVFPLDDSVYEGVPAKVPHSADWILIEEYGPSSLVNTDFRDHHWDASSQKWLKKQQLVEQSKQ